MTTEDFDILREHSSTADLVDLDLGKCPWGIVEDLTGLVQEHLRRLKNNCMAPYNWIQKAREKIASTASSIRNILT